jgi:hypothetical protein
MCGSQQPPMAAAVAAILSRWEIRESNQIHVAVGSHRKMRRVCHPHAAPKACGAAKKGAALRHTATPTDTTHYRAPTLAGAAVHPRQATTGLKVK